jgi:hypothetical protein
VLVGGHPFEEVVRRSCGHGAGVYGAEDFGGPGSAVWEGCETGQQECRRDTVSAYRAAGRPSANGDEAGKPLGMAVAVESTMGGFGTGKQFSAYFPQ